jgi:hypothetical protein
MPDVSLNTLLSNVNNYLSAYDGNNAGTGSQLQTLGARLEQDTVSGNTGDYKSTLGQYLGLLENAEKSQPGSGTMIQNSRVWHRLRAQMPADPLPVRVNRMQ